MPKPVKKKRSSDINEIAFDLVRRTTEESESEVSMPVNLSTYMAEIGRKGGKIGGKRRLETMSKTARKRAAKKAAKARWARAKKRK